MKTKNTKRTPKKQVKRSKKREHVMVNCGGFPRCKFCGADEDDVYVANEPCE